jgi:hypothetical protein
MALPHKGRFCFDGFTQDGPTLLFSRANKFFPLDPSAQKPLLSLFLKTDSSRYLNNVFRNGKLPKYVLKYRAKRYLYVHK